MQIIHGYDYIRSQKIGGENPLNLYLLAYLESLKKEDKLEVLDWNF